MKLADHIAFALGMVVGLGMLTVAALLDGATWLFNSVAEPFAIPPRFY